MLTRTEEDKIRSVIAAFAIEGDPGEIQPIETGHINDTYRFTMRSLQEHVPAKDAKVYILQRINQHVFHHPDEVMANIAAVTGWIRRKLQAQNVPDLSRRVLSYEKTKEGCSFYVAEDGSYWRICQFITGASCYDLIRTPDDFYQVGLAFGQFQQLLSDFPAQTLRETIPDFHNTPRRLQTFCASVKKDAVGRCTIAAPEIQWILQHTRLASVFYKKEARPQLPLRVTHNDAKLNNIMIDDKTGQAVCVLDLDTVMPGYVMYDFGDAIRSGATTAREDEADLSKVAFDLPLYRVFADGFLAGCGGQLTKEEITLLPLGALVITYEQAIRFLGDYLDGDVYYKISRPDENLDRARNQLRLLQDMMKHKEEMTLLPD